jgi:hypothetical protein
MIYRRYGTASWPQSGVSTHQRSAAMFSCVKRRLLPAILSKPCVNTTKRFELRVSCLCARNWKTIWAGARAKVREFESREYRPGLHISFIRLHQNTGDTSAYCIAYSGYTSKLSSLTFARAPVVRATLRYENSYVPGTVLVLVPYSY